MHEPVPQPVSPGTDHPDEGEPVSPRRPGVDVDAHVPTAPGAHCWALGSAVEALLGTLTWSVRQVTHETEALNTVLPSQPPAS